ncbi:UNVERIFIED_CONTAM: Transcription initiation factor IIB [Sesamum radiatum]|uniref:Transcription initiation factor IIB n=1 Tax=Sesamum radiatum TaxID=300843 RepID=A0AAW2N9T3_SESRA
MKEFNRAVEFIKEKMMVEMGESFIEVGTANAGDYLKRFCSKLGMSHEDTRTVRETIHNSEQLDIRDIQPYAHRILPERYVKGWDLKKLGPVGA